MLLLLAGIGLLGGAPSLTGFPMLAAMLAGLVSVVVGATLVHRQRRGG